MKARLLKQLLNNTGYTVSNNPEYIAVGSAMCHDLISVNKETLKITYALDTFKEGRKCLVDKGSEELLFIWDKLQELIDAEQIKDIIEGKDHIENPLPVFYTDDGILIESSTDAYGWPNTTIDGDIMWENTYFKTEKEAIEYGMNDMLLAFKQLDRQENDLNDKLSLIKANRDKYSSRFNILSIRANAK